MIEKDVFSALSLFYTLLSNLSFLYLFMGSALILLVLLRLLPLFRLDPNSEESESVSMKSDSSSVFCLKYLLFLTSNFYKSKDWSLSYSELFGMALIEFLKLVLVVLRIRMEFSSLMTKIRLDNILRLSRKLL